MQHFYAFALFFLCPATALFCAYMFVQTYF
jgi:hypothetical protein